MRRYRRIMKRICTMFIMLLLFMCNEEAVMGQDMGTETRISVTDIEIADYEEELYVGENLTLSVNVLPSDATNSNVTYKSSDASVATVSSSGEVKGISKGNVIIYVSADNITKKIPLTVKVATTAMKVNSNYLVLKNGNTFQLSAEITPVEADQSITYYVIDENVATVSESGLVTAKNEGNTTIVVSNEEASVAVSVIVNKQVANETEEKTADDTEVKENEYSGSVNAFEIEKIDTETLYYLYVSGDKLNIEGDGYTVKIDGNSIVNYKNEFYTDINLVKQNDGISFCLNQGNSLCGDICVELEDLEGKYLYLYNTSKDKYELIQTDNMDKLELTTAGDYRITYQKMNDETEKISSKTTMNIIACILSGLILCSIAELMIFGPLGWSTNVSASSIVESVYVILGIYFVMRCVYLIISCYYRRNK